MFQNGTRLEKPVRWVTGVLERSRDAVVLGGGMIGLAFIVGIIVIGVHERESSFRSTSPSVSAEDAPAR
jgi:hypothetical protein